MAKEVKPNSNIFIIDKTDAVYIKIMKDGALKDSGSGKSKLLASSGGFAKVEGLTGDVFKDQEIGLNLILSLRVVKAPKAEVSKSAKKKGKRLDDDD